MKKYPGAITNVNGQLSLPLPAGDYQQSCAGCVFDGKSLTCSCKDSGGNFAEPSTLTLDQTKKDPIVNINGQLTYKR
jgi:hypothetical protein